MSSRLITNANAPVVDIKITIDYRCSPESIKMDMSQNAQFVPGLKICESLSTCVTNLLKMFNQGPPQQAQPAPDKAPDLPPAPSN